MRKLFLALLASAAFALPAQAQCVGAGNINIAVLPGMNCNSEPTMASYFATGVGIAAAASATDIACLTGSASRVVRAQQIRVSGTAGTLITVPVRVMKHTVANSAGTAATGDALPVPTRMDTGSAVATATTTAYTANPTIDATAVQLDVGNLTLTTTGTTVAQPYVLFDWTSRLFMQAPVLRGVAQQLCVNLNGTSPSTGVVNVSFKWTEAAQ